MARRGGRHAEAGGVVYSSEYSRRRVWIAPVGVSWLA